MHVVGVNVQKKKKKKGDHNASVMLGLHFIYELLVKVAYILAENVKASGSEIQSNWSEVICAVYVFWKQN